MRVLTILAATGSLLALQGYSAIADAGPNDKCQSALEAHIRSIQNRDVAAYAETITTGDEFTIIFPSGDRSTTRDEAISLHQEWFSDPNWQMTFTEVQRRVSKRMCVVLLDTSYKNTPDSETHNGWLTLVFQSEGKVWRLVFDQNTRK